MTTPTDHTPTYGDSRADLAAALPEMQITEHELAVMTKASDEIHREESMPKLMRVVREWREELFASREGDSAGRSRATSRRHFLLGAGGVAVAGGVLAACGSSPSASKGTSGAGGSASSTTMAPTKSGLSSADSGSLAVDASIENLAIFAYESALKAATAGKLGKVPPAVATFATTALAHHKDHLAAFNSVLTAAGLKAVTVPDPALTPTVNKDFAKVKNVTELAQLAVLLENTAAQSYQDDAATMVSVHARATAASIMPVEMTHAAILYFVLGQYPGVQTSSGTPLAFNPLSLARPNSDVSSS